MSSKLSKLEMSGGLVSKPAEMKAGGLKGDRSHLTRAAAEKRSADREKPEAKNALARPRPTKEARKPAEAFFDQKSQAREMDKISAKEKSETMQQASLKKAEMFFKQEEKMKKALFGKKRQPEG